MELQSESAGQTSRKARKSLGGVFLLLEALCTASGITVIIVITLAGINRPLDP